MPPARARRYKLRVHSRHTERIEYVHILLENTDGPPRLLQKRPRTSRRSNRKSRSDMTSSKRQNTNKYGFVCHPSRTRSTFLRCRHTGERESVLGTSPPFAWPSHTTAEMESNFLSSSIHEALHIALKTRRRKTFVRSIGSTLLYAL